MPQYEVEVRISEINESDALAARLRVEEGLRAAGFTNWRVVAVAPKSRSTSLASALETRPYPRRNANYIGSVLLVAAVVAWVLWFLWVLTG
ncbi:MAG: hypothetical protein N3C12_15865 [Candidatus Binatia bacterium]|nr:hypothetical protein [Candidatus Binatia bacterium]